jgi:MshEN domain
MNASSHNQVENKPDIEDLLDGQSDEPAALKCVYEPVILGLEENKLEYRLENFFYPQDDREIIVIDNDINSLIFSIEELQFLAFVNIPLQIDLLSINDIVEVIDTFKGGSFAVRIPNGQDFDTGFFGLSVNPEDRYKYIYFPFNNIRMQYQQRPIGDILVENNFMSEDVLHNVLRKQYQLRCLRLGTILSKRANLQSQEVEKTLKDTDLQKQTAKSLTGQRLIQAGLASDRIVKQSLALQNRIRHMKVGELFVEMGYLTEDQMFIALAKKFKKRYVKLHNITPESEALASLPLDLIRDLEIIPIRFQDERLVIATSDPSDANLYDILKEWLSCPFELVISPYRQIIEALANLPT